MLSTKRVQRPSINFLERGDASLILPPFASLSEGLFNTTTSAVPNVKEERTGVEFSREFCCRGRRGLVGTGPRMKKIAGIKSIPLYALGLYVDEHAARGVLRRKFAGQSVEAMGQALFDELLHAESVSKSLVLVMTSGLVNRRNFVHALDSRLSGAMARANEAPVLTLFRSQFNDVDFHKGLQVAFTVTDGKLTTSAAGREVGTIASAALTLALLDAYLGKEPVSREAKQSFAEGLARLATS